MLTCSSSWEKPVPGRNGTSCGADPPTQLWMTPSSIATLPGTGFSQELLQVSIFLAAFSGLYFTVYAVTDSTYRDQFFHEITDELERAVGVRTAYLALRRSSSSAAGSDA